MAAGSAAGVWRGRSPAAAIWTVALAGLVRDLFLRELALAVAIAARLLAHDFVRAAAAIEAPSPTVASAASSVGAHLPAASAREPAPLDSVLDWLLLNVCLASPADGGPGWHGDHDRVELQNALYLPAAAAGELLDRGLQALEAAALVCSALLFQLGPREGVRDLLGLAVDALQLLRRAL